MQLWNTYTSAIVSRDANMTENSIYISMKFGIEVHVFCWVVGYLIVLASNQFAVIFKKKTFAFVPRAGKDAEKCDTRVRRMGNDAIRM